MAKSIFTIRSEFQGQKRSILEISEQLVKAVKALSNYDNVFSSPIYAKQGFGSEQLSINDANIISVLSNLILESHKPDIKKNEGEENPTVNFSRDFGFRLLLDFKDGKKKIFSLTAVLGSVRYQNIRIEYFNNDFAQSQIWYESILKVLINESSPIYAGVTINLSSFLDLQSNLQIRYPFGWVTYFSRENTVQIPDDLEGVEYEFMESGKYIILTREDFTTSKEAYEKQRDKLLELMKEIKSKVPEYTLT